MSLLALSLRNELGWAMVIVVLWSCIVIWRRVIRRWHAGTPIIAFARRRPVPWRSEDVLLVFLAGMLILPGAAMLTVRGVLGKDAARAVADKPPSMEHPAQQLLETGNVGMIALAAFMALIVAPLTEELLFRVILQGWLEAAWSRKRREHPWLRQAPFSWVPLVMPAFLFALMHIRGEKGQPQPAYLSAMMAAQVATDIATLVLTIVFLRLARGAKATDFGWKPETLGNDSLLGILAMLAITPPLIVVHQSLGHIVQWSGVGLAPDPVPLFLFALVLGTLFQRTHRLAPSLVLHTTFNAMSLLMLFMSGK